MFTFRTLLGAGLIAVFSFFVVPDRAFAQTACFKCTTTGCASVPVGSTDATICTGAEPAIVAEAAAAAAAAPPAKDLCNFDEDLSSIVDKDDGSNTGPGNTPNGDSDDNSGACGVAKVGASWCGPCQVLGPKVADAVGQAAKKVNVQYTEYEIPDGVTIPEMIDLIEMPEDLKKQLKKAGCPQRIPYVVGWRVGEKTNHIFWSRTGFSPPTSAGAQAYADRLKSRILSSCPKLTK